MSEWNGVYYHLVQHWNAICFKIKTVGNLTENLKKRA